MFCLIHQAISNSQDFKFLASCLSCYGTCWLPTEKVVVMIGKSNGATEENRYLLKKLHFAALLEHTIEKSRKAVTG